MKRLILLAALFIYLSLTSFLSALTSETETIVLWPDGAPGAVGSEDIDIPTLTIYLPSPDKANGTAIVICPGGGYGHLAMDHEGHQIARWANSLGVAGIILKYRIAPRYHHPAPMQDVQRAIRTVRVRARDWHIDPNRIGVIGFSAGGHLASTAGTHFDVGKPDARDPIERQSCRPDFMILLYPVITMENEYTHKGSRKNLLGENPSGELVALMSNEKQVTAQTPPTFLVHTSNDRVVPVQNSILFYTALHNFGIPAEMHIYENGPHGFGLGRKDPILSTWPQLCADWLRQHGLLRK